MNVHATYSWRPKHNGPDPKPNGTLTRNVKPWPDTTIKMPVNNGVNFRGDPASFGGVTKNPVKTDVPGPQARGPESRLFFPKTTVRLS